MADQPLWCQCLGIQCNQEQSQSSTEEFQQQLRSHLEAVDHHALTVFSGPSGIALSNCVSRMRLLSTLWQNRNQRVREGLDHSQIEAQYRSALQRLSRDIQDVRQLFAGSRASSFLFLPQQMQRFARMPQSGIRLVPDCQNRVRRSPPFVVQSGWQVQMLLPQSEDDFFAALRRSFESASLAHIGPRLAITQSLARGGATALRAEAASTAVRSTWNDLQMTTYDVAANSQLETHSNRWQFREALQQPAPAPIIPGRYWPISSSLDARFIPVTCMNRPQGQFLVGNSECNRDNEAVISDNESPIIETEASHLPVDENEYNLANRPPSHLFRRSICGNDRECQNALRLTPEDFVSYCRSNPFSTACRYALDFGDDQDLYCMIHPERQICIYRRNPESYCSTFANRGFFMCEFRSFETNPESYCEGVSDSDYSLRGDICLNYGQDQRSLASLGGGYIFAPGFATPILLQEDSAVAASDQTPSGGRRNESESQSNSGHPSAGNSGNAQLPTSSVDRASARALAAGMVRAILRRDQSRVAEFRTAISSFCSNRRPLCSEAILRLNDLNLTLREL